MSLKTVSGYAKDQLPALPYDKEAADTFKLTIPSADSGGGNADIILQFPPKINTDSKAANWQEDMRYGSEEFAMWKGAKARIVNIELNYVVWGSIWTQDKIQQSVQKIKQHLYVSGVGVKDKVPFIFIEGWNVIKVGEKSKPAFRLMGVNITYSKEYVGSGKNYWPLHTKIDLQCKLFTKEGSLPGEGSKLRSKIDFDSAEKAGYPLPEKAEPEWS